MSVTVTRADEADLDAWDDWVAASPQSSVFHRLAVLRAVERHADATLHPLVGFVGQEPVGLFPAFEVTKGPVATVFSPPPSMGIPYLGPIQLNHRKLKQRKREQRNQQFIEGAFEWLDDHVGQRFTHLVATPGYTDARPLQWNDFEVTPKYTYELALPGDPESLIGEFSSDPRRRIRNAPTDAYSIRETADAVPYVIDRVNDRHERTSGGLELSVPYARDLLEAIPDHFVHEARVDDRPVSGQITLRDDDTLLLWQGTPKPDEELPVNINDLLTWETFLDAMDAGIERVDFCGANTPRLCAYNAKFNPTTLRYFEAQRGTPVMNAASSLYRRLGS